jgi:hypothetical protein
MNQNRGGRGGTVPPEISAQITQLAGSMLIAMPIAIKNEPIMISALCTI